MKSRRSAQLNGALTDDGVAKGMPKIDTDIDAAEVILMLAPETNGEVAVKAWEALSKITGREHAHLALPERTRRSASATSRPSRARSSLRRPGPASRVEKVCYNAGYTNVHELIPWRTLTGRQQLYQDHLWMRAFGEGLRHLEAAGRPEDDPPASRTSGPTATRRSSSTSSRRTRNGASTPPIPTTS